MNISEKVKIIREQNKKLLLDLQSLNDKSDIYIVNINLDLSSIIDDLPDSYFSKERPPYPAEELGYIWKYFNKTDTIIDVPNKKPLRPHIVEYECVCTCGHNKDLHTHYSIAVPENSQCNTCECDKYEFWRNSK